MKISFHWLRELLSSPDPVLLAGAERVAGVLTRVGLEVEGIEKFGAGFSGVVVAEVLGSRPHPDAEKLRIVRVRAGGREDDVVCGAPNVPEAGGRVCWARPGAKLLTGTIEARPVRGVLSPGMLCGADELGLANGVGDDEGLMILPGDAPDGDDLAAYLGLPDVLFEVNVTPNRSDALSHLGIAREVAAAHWDAGVRVALPALPVPPVTPAKRLVDVAVADPEVCPRYTAHFLSGVRVAPSPLTARLRLQSCGVRSISNVVDATNYVLLETGQPLHAFDADRLTGALVVRRAQAGETLRTLDGVDRTLVPGDVVIADASGPVALAGVMGGVATQVTPDTRNLLLEAAVFQPTSIRRTSKRLALPTEAAHRFERGVDVEGVRAAAERAGAVLVAWCGGTLATERVDCYPQPGSSRSVSLSLNRYQRVTGQPGLSLAEAAQRLAPLGFEVTAASVSNVTVKVPTYRPDVQIAEDLIEELLRTSNALSTPADVSRVQANHSSRSSPEQLSDRARRQLAALGLHEVVTWGFVPRASLRALGAAVAAPDLTEGVAVKNPISADYEVMRTSLLPGLAAAVARNLSRGVTSPYLFEVGPVIRRAPGPGAERPTGGALTPVQRTHAAGLVTGAAAGWLRPGPGLDFFDAKAFLVGLLHGLVAEGPVFGRPAAPVPFLHPGVSAAVSVGGAGCVGHVGELHPVVARLLSLADVPAFYFEVDIDALEQGLGPGGQLVRAVAPPRFPAITRDVSFWIDVEVPADDQKAALVSANATLLHDLAVIEDFRDPAYAPPGKKGMLWSLTYRAPDRTLTDAEVDAAHATVVAALAAQQTIRIR